MVFPSGLLLFSFQVIKFHRVANKIVAQKIIKTHKLFRVQVRVFKSSQNCKTHTLKCSLQKPSNFVLKATLKILQNQSEVNFRARVFSWKKTELNSRKHKVSKSLCFTSFKTRILKHFLKSFSEFLTHKANSTSFHLPS